MKRMYKTDIATEDEIRDWNEIIYQCPYSEALHTLEWREALKTCFKQLEPFYLIIKDAGNNIVGAVPSFVFRPIPAIKTLLSMPWSLPGGPLLFPRANVEEAIRSAMERLDKLSTESHSYETTLTLPVDCGSDIIKNIESAGYSGDQTRFTHILDIREGYETVWDAYNKRIRGAVRKAQKSGVIVREAENESEIIDFYKLYMLAMGHFNSTPKPYQLLRYLQTSPIARLVVAELDQKIIGGLLFLHFNSCVRLWCEASDPDFLSYRPNNAVIDYIIQWACKHGYSRVDFGASPVESHGLVSFKEEWKARKVYFCSFTKVYSSWKKEVWVFSEPTLRRLYSGIQKFRIRWI